MKSTIEDASLGIAQASVVEDAAKLKERIEFVHEQVGSDALVEEYIEGRELYVGVMGNERLHAPAGVGDGVRLACPTPLPAIATRKVKWDKRYQATLRHHHPRRRGSAAGGAWRASTGSRAASIGRWACPATRAWIFG